jgi:APA family basic amino acid/polyamine antiporter
MSSADKQSDSPRRQLTLLDSTSIIVGIIIGVGIYEITPRVAGNVHNPLSLMGVWLLGGMISFVGALCYAELTTSFPEEGGTYVFLTRAFGRRMGFLFAWSDYWIVRPGNVGMLAYAFARYATKIQPLSSDDEHALGFYVYACAAVIAMTAMNILGVRTGKWTQNLLTMLKVVGLLAIFVIVMLPLTSSPVSEPAPAGKLTPNYQLAIIFVLFTFGGWDEISCVAAEVRDPRKNLLRALIAGVVVVTAVYLLVNLTFTYALGLDGFRQSNAVAADVVGARLGWWGEKGISLLVCASCLGAVNGLIFTGSRIYYAMGAEHPMYGFLGKWNSRLGTPVRSLTLQAAISLTLVTIFRSKDAFDKLLIFTTPVFWIFFLLVGVSLFVLRRHEPTSPQPFRVPLYPVTPILFCLSSLFMLYSSLTYAWVMQSYEAFVAIGIVGVGLLASFLERRR